MHRKLGSLVGALALSLAGCLPEATLDTDAQKVSYGKGLEAARSMGGMGDSLDLVAFLAGLTDGLDEVEPAVAAEEIEAAAARFFDGAGRTEDAGGAGESADGTEDAAEQEAQGEHEGRNAGQAADTTGSAPEG